MHKISVVQGPRLVEALNSPPMGPGFPADLVIKADRMETWGTSLNDAGPDFCEFRLFNAKGVTIGTRRVDGF